MKDALPQPTGWTPRPIVDIGANLTSPAFDPDRLEVLARARAAGVAYQLLTGSSVDSSEAAAALAAEHPGELAATAGVHPHEADNAAPGWLQRLETVAQQPAVRALGETGLDFNRDYSPRPVQERAFEAQLELAAGLGLPVFLHERDSGGRFFDLLARWRPRLTRAVLHCFTGDAQALRRALDLDLHLGVTGWICDERRGAALQRLARDIPSERLVIETDAPYLTPRTIRPRPRSRRNEPGYLPWVVMTLAACRDADPEALARLTTANACRLFDLPLPTDRID